MVEMAIVMLVAVALPLVVVFLSTVVVVMLDVVVVVVVVTPVHFLGQEPPAAPSGEHPVWQLAHLRDAVQN